VMGGLSRGLILGFDTYTFSIGGTLELSTIIVISNIALNALIFVLIYFRLAKGPIVEKP